MCKIIGKSILLFLLLQIMCIDARIRLEMHSVDGVMQNSALVGQPFLLDVVIDGVQGSVSNPHIDGLQDFNARRTGLYMSSINGVSTTKYTYQVRIDHEGHYILGPARLMHQQQELISNTITVVVENGVKNVQTQQKNSKKSELKAFLRLKVDEDHVVVGQQVKATLRFYYQDTSMSLANLGQPDIQGFEVKAAQQPTGGVEDINGIHYKYAEWQWCMYPTKAGEFVIPAYSADYEIPVKDNHVLSGFFLFMNPRADRKRVYSNSVKITVDSLPHHTGAIDAVGCFESFQATISPSIAKEGEGMVLALEITGIGDLSAIKTPLLQMPSALKYYDSNAHIIEARHNDELPKKRFEFIVQGMKSGDWEIPAQSFVYFDIDKHAYVTLKTSPLSVSIQQSHNVPVMQPPLAGLQEKEVHVHVITIAPLNVTGPWYHVAERDEIPWIIFYCVIFLPIMCIGYPVWGNRLLRATIVRRYLKKKACKDAAKKIKICIATQNPCPVYGIFIELFAVLKNQQTITFSGHEIEILLKDYGFTENDYHEWNIFFAEAAHAAYGKFDRDRIDRFCGIALQWLKRLEQLV